MKNVFHCRINLLTLMKKFNKEHVIIVQISKKNSTRCLYEALQFVKCEPNQITKFTAIKIFWFYSNVCTQWNSTAVG